VHVYSLHFMLAGVMLHAAVTAAEYDDCYEEDDDDNAVRSSTRR